MEGQNSSNELIKHLRGKQRGTWKHNRQESRNAKRQRYDPIRLAQPASVDEVKQAIQCLKEKTSSHVHALRVLRDAFTYDLKIIDLFLSCDQGLQCLVTDFTGSNPELQLESVWCVTNIAAGSDKHALTVLKQTGAYLCTYLTSTNPLLQEQCAWALGNIAASGHKCKAMLLAQGVIQPLVHLLQSPSDGVVQSAAFALSNLARGDQQTAAILVHEGFMDRASAILLKRDARAELLSDVLWLLCNVFGSIDSMKDVPLECLIKSCENMLSKYTEQGSENIFLLTPLIRTLGHILSRSDESIRCFCQGKGVEYLGRNLQSQHSHIRKESIWVLSSVAAVKVGSEHLLQADLLPPLIQLLERSFCSDIIKEVLHCVLNLCSYDGSPCDTLLKLNVLPPLARLLTHADTELVKLTLCLFEYLLASNTQGDPHVQFPEVLAQVELLKFHTDSDVSTRAIDLLDLAIS